MTLAADFQFTQGSLQDYADCPRRFQLRYLLGVAWPAVEAEPVLENEEHLRQGVAFHRLVHQHLLGIPRERLSLTVTNEDLRRWWQNYLDKGPADLPASRYPEVVLSAPVSGYRLVAKYDLIAVDSGRPADLAEPSGQGLSRAVIVDWKTSLRRPSREWLGHRLQTRVYPYVLMCAGAHLNDGQPLEPKQVEMLYWFANFPTQPEHFAYDASQHEADRAYLASLIEEIESLEDEDFALTTDERHCRFCTYRSFCRRGVRAGMFGEAEDESEWDVDLGLEFEQIAEIEY